MNTLYGLWRRLPVVIQAFLLGGVVSLTGVLPWMGFVSINLWFKPALPWVVPIALLYLLAWWKVVRRQPDVRNLEPTEDQWSGAILAGFLGLMALVIGSALMNRMVQLPQQQTGDIPQIPMLSLFVYLVASAAFAGVVEETAFRGFMQRRIEQRHGPAVAIVITSTAFGFAHFTHPEVTLALMPFFIGAGVVYGLIAYLTDSVLPSMFLHTMGNIFSGFDLFTRGQSEWQTPKAPAALIWETGPDATFWFGCAAFVLVSCAAAFAYGSLARTSTRPSTRTV